MAYGYTGLCEECGTEFWTSNARAVCCSDECRRKRQRRAVKESQARRRKWLQEHAAKTSAVASELYVSRGYPPMPQVRESIGFEAANDWFNLTMEGLRHEAQAMWAFERAARFLPRPKSLLALRVESQPARPRDATAGGDVPVGDASGSAPTASNLSSE